jgi:hypothetical protein
MSDLRSSGRLTAASADSVFVMNRTAGPMRWNAGRGRWEAVGTSATAPPGGELSLAPGGKELFHAGWETLRRSTDGGATWKTLTPPARSGSIVGFSGFYTVTRTLFGMWGDIKLAPMRSEDAGETWQPLPLAVDLGSGFTTPQITSQGYEVYLVSRRYSSDDSLLLRSTDDGVTWQMAAAEASRGVHQIALTPDRRLWLGDTAGLRAVNPDTLSWTVITPRGVSSTPPPVTPTPALEACTRSLEAADREVAAKAPELGCPVETPKEIDFARQDFESGQMLWRGDERVIYVLGPGMAAGVYSDLWQEGQPDSDPALVPPANRVQPLRGFGKVWREQLRGPDAAIGWARGPERGLRGFVQRWERGTAVRFGGELIIIGDGGYWK